MAGKRQHYVPRLLQRGFLHDPEEESQRTWLHRRGVKASLGPIKRVGAGKWFYSRSLDGQPTLDDLITMLESDLGTTIGCMRGALPGALVDPQTAAHCVVHLVMRTDHIRRLISKGLESLTNEVQLLYGDPCRLGSMLRLNAQEPSHLFTDAVQEMALRLGPAGVPPSLTESMISFLVREDPDNFIRHLQAAASPFFARIRSSLATAVRDAHNRILPDATRESSGWVSRLSTFRWTVEAGEELILPDCVALAAEADGRLVALPFTTAKAAEAVVLPVSHERILVGICADRDPVDLTHFNKHAAAACTAFFISARPLDDQNLADLIGTAPATAIEAAIDKATGLVGMDEVANAPLLPTPSQAQAFVQREFSYTVRLADFGDAVLEKEISDVIEVVVRELARRLPLHDLDGFTIALDCQRALAKLDRGDPDLPLVKNGGGLAYGFTVATRVTVKRSGVQKEHIVLSAELAQSLVSSDVKVLAIALNILVKMLASMAHSTKFAETTDSLIVALHAAVVTAPPRWFAARESAYVVPSLLSFYAAAVVETIQFAEREIATERAKSRELNDVGPVYRRALEHVYAILGRAADWLGYRAGLPKGEAFEGDDLPVRLQPRGLDRWLELFGRDLAAVYEDEAGINMAVATRLSQHVDRMLWALGVFAWVEGEDVRCIVTEQADRASAHVAGEG